MNPVIQQKLERLKDRVEELNALLADPTIISAHQTFRELSIELSDIEPVVAQYATGGAAGVKQLTEQLAYWKTFFK